MRTDENSFEKFQRLLRTPEGKKKEITACLLPLKQQSEIALKNIEEYESKEKMFDDEKKRIEDKPKFTGISDRELYLKNKKIIEIMTYHLFLKLLALLLCCNIKTLKICQKIHQKKILLLKLVILMLIKIILHSML